MAENEHGQVVIPFCPFKHKDCRYEKGGKIYQCQIYVNVRGKNPNTGAEEDTWACALSWMPVLQVQNAQKIRSFTASNESLRNVINESGGQLSALLGNLANNLPIFIQKQGEIAKQITDAADKLSRPTIDA